MTQIEQNLTEKQKAKEYSASQAFYLLRLNYALSRRVLLRDEIAKLVPSAQRKAMEADLKLANWVCYSVFGDCEREGVKSEAQTIITKWQSEEKGWKKEVSSA